MVKRTCSQWLRRQLMACVGTLPSTPRPPAGWLLQLSAWLQFSKSDAQKYSAHRKCIWRMKPVVNTEVNKAGGCTDCRAVAFNSLTITAIRQLLLPVSCTVPSRALLLNSVAEASRRCWTQAKNATWNKPGRNLHLEHKLQDFVCNIDKIMASIAEC